MIDPASSTSTGMVKPHSRIEAAICPICSSECVRAFCADGTKDPIGRRSTASAGHSGAIASKGIPRFWPENNSTGGADFRGI
jgi:hypothetical protein